MKRICLAIFALIVGFATVRAATPLTTQIGSTPTAPKSSVTPAKPPSKDRKTDEKSSDKDSDKKTGDKSKEASKGKAPTGGAVTKQAPVQRITKKSTSGSRRGARQSKKVTPPKFQFPSDAVKACLRFFPGDVFAEKGDTVDVNVVFSNRSNDGADGVSFTVLYDTQRATLVEADTSPLKAYMGDAADQLRVEETPGTVRIKADLARPLKDEETTLASLRFALKDVAGRSAFRFLRPPDGVSAVFSRGENILGDSGQGLYGLVDANVFVLPDEAARPVVLDNTSLTSSPGGIQHYLEQATPYDTETSRTREVQGWLHTPPAARRDAEAWLALQGPSSPVVEVGSDFWVDLVLINDTLMPIDSLGVAVSFDPKVLQVIDEDKDNWIFRGVNAWDGAFHEAYPFDFHRTNKADNVRGVLHYQVARHAGAWDFASGVFARVHFRAVAPSRRTEVGIRRDEANGPDRYTWLRAYGLDRLDRSYRGKEPPKVILQITP